MIFCRTLGPVAVSVDGGSAPPELLWRKNLALLVYLARSPKRARAREHLIGLLWGDKPEGAARHSLNEAVRVLRRHVGEGGVETEAGQVRLVAGAVELDTERLETLLAAKDYRGAVELVAGEFLEGFAVSGASAFEDWMTAERALWRGRSVDALLRRADELLGTGDLMGAHETAQRALGLDPTSDVAVRAAMRCRALGGDRAGALECYETFAARLAGEVDTEPDTDTKALAERVRRERAWRLPVGAGAGAGRAAGEAAESRRAPLVGRARELARLLEAWTACRRDRRAAVAIVEGDAGTGKTRLAEELLGRARLDGAAVAAVRAVEADRDQPWSGVLGIARGGLLAIPGVAGASPAALAELRDQGAPAPGLGRSLVEGLRAVCEEQPVVVLVDDAQWLDRESLLTLVAVVRDLAREPLVILFTVAPQPARAELDELRVRLGREVAGTTVRLESLSGDALRDLARWALPQYNELELDRVARRVATDSAGIPLLAVELLHAVAMGLDLRETKGAWPEPFKTLDQTLPGELPDAVVAAIRIGFRRLSPDAQRALAVAAVVGGRVSRETLGSGSGLQGEGLHAALDELEWQRWLAAEPRGYALVARIVRDVVAQDMVTEGQRQRILAAIDGAAHPM